MMTERFHKFISGGALRLVAAMVCAGALTVDGSTARAADAGEPPAAEETLQVVVSLKSQRLDLYRGDELLASSKVSTGRRGHRTPAGVYSVLQKRRRHFSNLYDNAPMPYMQRLTWSGIALHQGHLPGYPASHGCIRLPRKFARQLFKITDIGAKVVITQERNTPFAIDHPELFSHQGPIRFDGAVLAPEYVGARRGSRVSPVIAAAFDVEIQADDAYRAAKRAEREHSDAPLRILITKRSGKNLVRESQRLLDLLGYEPGGVDGVPGRRTAAAVRRFQTERGETATGVLDDALLNALYAAAGEPVMDGRLFVRQGRKDLFEGPVALIDPDAPLGTHVYNASNFTPAAAGGETAVDWTALTVEQAEGVDARLALSRVHVPDLLRLRVERALTPGSSLIISDHGPSYETGQGTDFIVQPR